MKIQGITSFEILNYSHFCCHCVPFCYHQEGKIHTVLLTALVCAVLNSIEIVANPFFMRVNEANMRQM
jgi:hypothetical protein